MKDFNEVIKNINPKDYIIAQVIDDGINKKKNFLVVGKDENYLYAIRITSKDQTQNDNYRKCDSMLGNKCIHYRWNTIFEIGKDEFIKKRGSVPWKIYSEIMREMAKKCKSYDNIDFSSANFLLKEGSIILKNEILYLVVDKAKGINKYKIVKLEEGKNHDASIQIKGSNYGICFDETTEIDSTDNDFIVISNFPNLAKKFVKKENKKYYEFGDVLSLKNSNEKVIYLTQIKGTVYYASLDQLELFTGICKVNKNKIEGFYIKSSDNELNKIVLKLERALTNDSYHLYSDDAKNSILDKVNTIKK